MLVKLFCTQCGAPMEVDGTRDFIFCQYCGNKIANIPQKIEINQNIKVNGTIQHRMDYSNQSNLIISYSSSNSAVAMIVVIDNPRGRHHFINGQTMSFRLPVGNHRIVMKIGKINYNRNIIIPPSNMPVKIYASWNNRAHITIDQP